MLNKLIKLANDLDKLGYFEQADVIDGLLKKIANEEKLSFITTDKEKVNLFDTEKKMINDLHELTNDALIFWWHFAKANLSGGSMSVGWKKDEIEYFYKRLSKLREIRGKERLNKKVPANEDKEM